jgi:hypothetical protein
MTALNFFLHGGIALTCWAIGLVYLRFFLKVRDRLFAILAGAFWLLAMERVLLAFVAMDREDRPLVYLIRLLAFVLIIAAVLDKNRVPRVKRPRRTT